MKHESAPVQNYGVLDTPDDVRASRARSSRPEVAPGLVLPDAGHEWALDKFGGQPQLVQLKYTAVQSNNHVVSNIAKENVAPFVYKPKATWEVPGPAAAVRLHTVTPVIFFVSTYDDEDAADSSVGLDSLALVKLQVHKDRRIVSTTAYTQLTGKAKRSEDQVETVTEKIGSSGWFKISPKEPLPPGEYGLVRLPKQANLLGAAIFDFAIDPSAPENPKAIQPTGAKEN